MEKLQLKAKRGVKDIKEGKSDVEVALLDINLRAKDYISVLKRLRIQSNKDEES